ncbi:CpaF/VirB11 family protein [Peribacillus sp. R9-11]|uniref:CpaF/VirB11 family protein n=1 Tax=Peribacillus sp. R9-11 TaxID=3073271 RepID=UPI00286856CF|nr:CpaF/VirB11 family protein [Peribacillus sp. R9-11]WMX58521.1 CpaF/VirB11 family protein [Peribacillus sp. R9-11]
MEIRRLGDSISPIIKPQLLKNIQETLIQSHAELIVRGLLDSEAREDLKYVVIKEHSHIVKGNKELADYIVQETVGTGIIEEIIRDETVTDIGYNGSDLIIEGNDKKKKYTGSTKITEEYIVRIIQKFANANGKDFTPKNSILDGKFGNIRINAVHKKNSTEGTTMSLRVVRPKLALRKENFTDFAPDYMYSFFEKFVQLRTNIAISGETGTGKTEFQKLLASFIPFKHKIVLIEDTAETFLKEMFPDKDILSWVTSSDVTITDLVKAALRNNPRWMLVSETRSMEAYEMIQAVLSGHHIITTLHAVNAKAIPRRFVNMAKMGYSVSEKDLEQDIRRYFDFGVHINRVDYKGEIIRYLSEVVEFNENKDETIFKQRFLDGNFSCETGKISESLKDRLAEANIEIDIPEEHKHTRYAKAETKPYEERKVIKFI